MCSHVHKFEKLNKLPINKFELNFYQDRINWEHSLITTEISKIDSNGAVGLIIYKNHYALNKKLNVFLGNNNKKFISRRFMNSYTSKNMLMMHKSKCENNEITTIRTSSESLLHWKDHFHKNPLYFRNFAGF